jgi:hypothetical protein
MNTLKTVLMKALAGAEHIDAFSTIQQQPHVRTLIGLLLAQGQSFDRARQARKQLFTHLSDQKVDPKSDQDMWVAINNISKEQWRTWGVAKTVRDAILGFRNKEISKIMTSSKEKQYRIGPWTRKAFMIMTAPDQPQENKDPAVLLTEDSWVRQRWDMLVRQLKLAPADYPLTLETCHLLTIHPIQLSRVLWRLTKDGVRRLVQKNSRPEQATHWFIPVS